MPLLDGEVLTGLPMLVFVYGPLPPDPDEAVREIRRRRRRFYRLVALGLPAFRIGSRHSRCDRARRAPGSGCGRSAANRFPATAVGGKRDIGSRHWLSAVA
jgi:hypothetical protein